jgi:serine/threonine-protein kinase
MELVEGESLADRLRHGPLAVDEAAPIAKQIGEALAAAHEKGIVHRDLKPANIMVMPDGHVKVLDFGLAKMIETEPAGSGLMSLSPTLSAQATLAGTILGTAPYMSPEQARGRAVDKRTDVWAFGCVLFEMLSGKRAFDGEDTTETIATIVKGEPDWSAIPASVPPNIVSVLRGCLTKNPKERFADIAVPLYLLTARGESSPAAPSPVAPAVPRWTRVLPVAAAAVVGALVMGAAAWLTRPSSPPPTVTKFTFPLTSGQILTNTGRKVIALSPDGSLIVYVANQQLYMRSMADTEPRLISGSDNNGGTITSPAFSPDGRELVFYAGIDSTLKRMSVTGGTPVTICAANNPSGLRWEPQGILFGQSGKGIFRVQANGGEPQKVVSSTADEIASAAETLPDDRGVLFSIRKASESWDVGNVMVQTSTGERKTLVHDGSDGRYDGAGHLLYALSGVVMAVPFDLDRLEIFGTPVPAIEGVMHQLGGQVSGIAQFSVAPNGTVAYVPGPAKIVDDGGLTLAMFDEKGGIESLDMAQGIYRAPRVSPDGRTVVFEAGADTDTQVWVQDLTAKTAMRRLTFGGHNRAPVWSSDSQWIAFQSDREGDAGIFRQRADGSGVAERMTKPESGVRHWPQSWSPDGAYLLFSVEKDKTFELDLWSMKDKTTSRFGDVTSAINLESAFSPDGHWIVYQRNDKPEAVNTQSFLEPFPATGAKYLVPIEGVAAHPYWSRKGDRLFFNTSANTSHFVDVRTSPTVSFSAPRPFPRTRRTEPNPATGRRGVDALPDGRILGIGTNLRITGTGTLDTAATDQITVILNWQQALTAKLAH